MIRLDEKSVVRTTVDLSGVSGYVNGEEDELIRSGLEEKGLLGEDYLYSVFDHSKVDRLLRTGSTRRKGVEVIYAFREEEMVWSRDSGEVNPVRDIVREYFEPGIAVYDRDGLTSAYRADSDFGYEFVNPDRKLEALKGIVELII